MVCWKLSAFDKGGKGRSAQVATLKEKAPKFEVGMRVHLKEEEETIPTSSLLDRNGE